MKCSKKSVNDHLRSLTYIKKVFVVPGTTGFGANHPFVLGDCDACFGESGQCVAIHINPLHEWDKTDQYYGVVDITPIITRWMMDGEYTRTQVVADIADECTKQYLAMQGNQS